MSKRERNARYYATHKLEVLAQVRAIKTQWKAEGRCPSCGRTRDGWQVNCSACRTIINRAGRAWRKRMKAGGQ